MRAAKPRNRGAASFQPTEEFVNYDTDLLLRYDHDSFSPTCWAPIPSAVWIGKKYYGVDIREHGSRNAGTTNMLARAGRRAAVPVFALDFLKGFVAVTLIELLKYDEHVGDIWIINLKIVAVFAAVLGHIFPVFAGFRGGKGVATLVGAITGIYPPSCCSASACGSGVLIVSHYVSLASMVAGCCFRSSRCCRPR